MSLSLTSSHNMKRRHSMSSCLTFLLLTSTLLVSTFAASNVNNGNNLNLNLNNVLQRSVRRSCGVRYTPSSSNGILLSHSNSNSNPNSNSRAVQLTQSRFVRQRPNFISSEEERQYHSQGSDYVDYGFSNSSEEDLTKLEEIKRGLERRLGGYRPYSVKPPTSRPGSYSWTTKLTFLNLAMFALQMALPQVTQFGAKRSDLILQGRQLHRLFTPMFLHGSMVHLMVNTFSLNNLGEEMERLFGPGRFMATYLAAGVAGNVMSAYKTPNPSLGASGAVFGLMGAYYTFLSRNEEFFGQAGRRAMGSVTATLGMNVMLGLSNPHIDNWAHMGGALGGAGMAIVFGPKLYLMGLPNGGRIIVDKPAFRLPPSIEAIPSNIGKTFRRTKVRMQVDRFTSDLTAKPWRRDRTRRRRNLQRRELKPFGQ